MKPMIRNLILDTIRARGLVTMDELIDLFAPSWETANPTLRERRKIALSKNIQRARRLAMQTGETIHTMRSDGVTRFCMARLPDGLIDDQTMAELTLGRAGA